MKKILFLATGGTIASSKGERGMRPTLSGKDITELVPELEGLCEIDCRIILSLDSTNIQPEDWQIIAAETNAGLNLYDGVVITHGTDTMAYTSSMLSFMLQGISKPVILTGSQKPIAEHGSDGKINILNAFKTAVCAMPGVYIVFGSKIINGTRARKTHTLLFDAFDSINAEAAGRLEDGKVIWEAPVARPGIETVFDDRLDANVFLLKLIPGTKPEIIDALVSLGYKGVVIEGFGLGGLPNVRRDLIPPLKKAIDSGVTVVMVTQCDRGRADLSVYEVGVRALEAGIICGRDMTAEAAVTKLMWALGRESDPMRIREIMETDTCGG